MHLLIDARNVLYRVIFGAKSRDDSSPDFYFSIFLQNMLYWINMHDATNVHVFWDAPRKEVWRRKILPTYKDRSTSYSVDISDDLKQVADMAADFFKNMNIRQYSRDCMEADDLIYAATTVIHPEKSMIISSDSDMVQIPYYFNSSSIFDPSKKEVLTIPSVNPVLQKVLSGDSSDKIPGYYGIGPKKSASLLESKSKLIDFVNNNDKQVYYRNMLLIDLSLNPKIMQNKIYVQNVMAEPLVFNKEIIKELIKSYNAKRLLLKFTALISPFEKLGNHLQTNIVNGE